MDKRTTGKMRITDGSIYNGSFKDDKFHGKGTITFLD